MSRSSLVRRFGWPALREPCSLAVVTPQLPGSSSSHLAQSPQTLCSAFELDVINLTNINAVPMIIYLFVIAGLKKTIDLIIHVVERKQS